MIIRYEAEQDTGAISELIAAAFAPMPFSSQTESRIVSALRQAGALTVSLVATEGDGLIGHAAYSPVTIAGRNCGWFGLGPVAVRPDLQRGGIGSALIHRGLEILRKSGAEGCVVLGNPDYYGRFGFEADPALWYDGAPPGKFMRLAFADGIPSGEVNYHTAFQVP